MSSLLFWTGLVVEHRVLARPAHQRLRACERSKTASGGAAIWTETLAEAGGGAAP